MRVDWRVWSTGFALFSMFFGSGNLVFPLSVGYESQGHFLLGAVGIVLTGVIVPFLGVLGMLLYKGDLNHFFFFLGKRGVLIFSFCLLALMGPFGVLARCLTVAHGALLLLFPQLTLTLSSLLICALIFLLSVNESKIVKVIGSGLTPLLLFAITAIVFAGLQQPCPATIKDSVPFEAFKNGFFQGYYIMDLLAAFFFSHFILKHLRQTYQNNEQHIPNIFFKASIIGASLLASVYVVLVILGWYYSPLFHQKSPQEFLGLIAFESLGRFAGPVVCLAIVFACLTTAIILTSLFADFIRQEMFTSKLTHKTSTFLTLSIGFSVSILEFDGIAKVLGPIVEIIYPFLILITFFNIFYFYYKKKSAVFDHA
ncbi:MAG: branched-chain amino acid transport system II carrier protein [Parachlamydiaceae bacterium]